MSRLKGVERTQKSVRSLSKRQKPSWCLLVRVTYLMPASFAIPTQASASNFTGLKRCTSPSYTSSGMWALLRIHSP